MERNWDLVRKILAQLEQLGDTKSFLGSESVTGFDQDTVSYHMKIMGEAGLIEAHCMQSNVGLHCYATRLTWEGHEFLAGIRNDTTWNRVKSTAREKGISLSFEAVKLIASSIIASLIKQTMPG